MTELHSTRQFTEPRVPSRPFCEFMLAILLLGISSAQAQVYYSTLNIQWNGQLDSSDDVLVTNQIDGIVTCLYAIAANGVTGENCDAAIFAYQYTGPGNPDGDWDEIFNEEVIEDNPGQESSASGVGSFGVVSNQVYQLEADVQNSGNAAASFFIPTSVLGALPAPWQQSDVGAVAVPGSAGCDTNNNFTIQASGSGITNQADAFHYVYQTLTGDGQIIACVTGVEKYKCICRGGCNGKGNPCSKFVVCVYGDNAVQSCRVWLVGQHWPGQRANKSDSFAHRELLGKVSSGRQCVDRLLFHKWCDLV